MQAVALQRGGHVVHHAVQRRVIELVLALHQRSMVRAASGMLAHQFGDDFKVLLENVRHGRRVVVEPGSHRNGRAIWRLSPAQTTAAALGGQ